MIPVTMIMAMTVDGKIARDKGQLANWTSPEDKKLFVQISKEYGVIMMGANTFRTFPSPLPKRLNVVFGEAQAGEEWENVKWVSGDPEPVLEELASLGYQSALLGGGAYLNSLFLEKKLITDIILTVEPKIFGAGLSLFDRPLDATLELQEVKKINADTITLRYRVKY